MTRAAEEHDYIGLSGVSLIKKPSDMPKSTPTKTSKSNFCKKPSNGLTLKATELRLGLPGLESPENGVNFSLGVVKNLVSGTKRGFSDTMKGVSSTWVLPKNGGSQMGSLKNAVSLSSSALGDDKNLQSSLGSEQDPVVDAPSKAQVVGWPPVRSFRKNSMTVNIPKTEDKDCKSETGCLFIKVSMDGAPYLRKVDLKTYGSYMELSSALGERFRGFTIGQLGNQGLSDQDELEKGDLHRHSEYVITYEDKDGDWMMVGDVPWPMFMDSCRRLRIIKSSEAVGLGSRVTEKLLP